MSDETQTETPAEPAAPAPAPAAPEAPPVAKYAFRVGRVLSTALRITQHNFLPFFVLACVLEIPVTLVQVNYPKAVLLAVGVQLIVTALTQAVVAYGTIMELQGSRPSTRACITTGLAQLGRVLGVTIVSSLTIGAGMILLVVPGIIMSLMFYVVVPVTLAEGLGVGAAMKRSRELTYGYKGDLFLIALIAGGVAIAQAYFYKGMSHEAAFIARELVTAATAMFFAVTVAVTYFELRKTQEGIEVPALATAFARIRK